VKNVGPAGGFAVSAPGGRKNPIIAAVGQTQSGVDPRELLPGRGDLTRVRLDAQRRLIQSATPRWTPIQVTPDGVIWDGHHGARAAAERALAVDVLVVAQQAPPSGIDLLQLPVR
jgi:hypothetical protein